MNINIINQEIYFNDGKGIFDRGSFNIYNSGYAVASAKDEKAALEKVAAFMRDGAGLYLDHLAMKLWSQYLETAPLQVYIFPNTGTRSDYLFDQMVVFYAREIRIDFNIYLKKNKLYSHTVDGKY